MSSLADRLSGPMFKLGRPVIDTTGVTGVYDFTLNWSPYDAQTNAGNSPSLFTALQEQLGLKLEKRTSMFAVVVVDSIEKAPTEN